MCRSEIPAPFYVANGPTGDIRKRSITASRNPNISIFGAAPALDTLTIYCDGNAIGQAIASPNNTWSYDNTAVALGDGDHFFSAMATGESSTEKIWRSLM